MPVPGELVIIQITKILPYGAFCKIIDYGNLEAFLHISEISSGWIKNIHEHIEEDRLYVAKVWKVSEEKQLYDVSLKRVTDKERKEKLEEERREKKCIKLIQHAAQKASIDYSSIQNLILEKYSSFSEFLDDLDSLDASNTKWLPSVFLENLKALVKSISVKKEIIVSKELHVIGKGPQGIIEIKNALLNAINKKIEVKYLSAGHYLLRISALKSKDGLKILDSFINNLKENNGIMVLAVNDKEN